MKKIICIFGTRPEAIKMAPVVKELQKKKEFETIVCVTGQHREMLMSVLDVFEIDPDYNLDVMRDNQSLFDVTNSILNGLQEVLENEKPDLILVHGDTTSSFVGALAGFYKQIPVAHVEAGLRTHDIYSPYPEEFNRQAISLVSALHFAPTEKAIANLNDQGIKENVYLTGNSAIDALLWTTKLDYENPYKDFIGNKKLILLTAHRRENLGEPLYNIFKAIKRVVDENEDVCVLYPIHKNPKVRSIANEILNDHPRIKLIEPLEVVGFHHLMNEAHIILTDSGGIQEEAPSLGKPVLVMRDTTERPEGIEAKTLKLVGTNEENIYENTMELLNQQTVYDEMAHATNPYGDGTTSIQIAKIVKEYLEGKSND